MDNTRATIDDDIDRGREMDDEDVRDWEKNLIKGSHIPGKVWWNYGTVPIRIPPRRNFAIDNQLSFSWF